MNRWSRGSAVKALWSGIVVSIQPRIRLMRSFDQRTHTYLGYVLQLDGLVDDESRTFTIAITEAAHAKHRLQVVTR